MRSLKIAPGRMVVALIMAVALAAQAGCGSDDPAGGELPNPVTGLITEVGKDYIVLKTTTGQKIRFDNADTEAPPSHLEEHRKQKLPVAVTHEPNGDRLIARTIADAPEG